MANSNYENQCKADIPSLPCTSFLFVLTKWFSFSFSSLAGGNLSNKNSNTKAGNVPGDAPLRGPLTPLSGEERRKASSDLKNQRKLHASL